MCLVAMCKQMTYHAGAMQHGVYQPSLNLERQPLAVSCSGAKWVMSSWARSVHPWQYAVVNIQLL